MWVLKKNILVSCYEHNFVYVLYVGLERLTSSYED